MTENLELREWIAVNLMGLRIVGRDKDFRDFGRLRAIENDGRTATPWSTKTVPPYELTWNDAALVVEAMAKRGYEYELRMENPENPTHVAAFGMRAPASAAPTAPLALCLAAKTAIEATR